MRGKSNLKKRIEELMLLETHMLHTESPMNIEDVPFRGGYARDVAKSRMLVCVILYA